MSDLLDYKKSGVDVEKTDDFASNLPSLLKSTWNESVLNNFGAFASYFELPKTGEFKNPVLATTCDGVGTKVILGTEYNRIKGLGIDLVAMSVNDLIAGFAKPRIFLDYFATSKFDRELADQLIIGIVEGCRQCGAALIGGETAEMPGLYAPGDFDLAGFAIGFAEKENLLKAKNIAPGTKIYGLKSSGFHSNGYSLVRKIIDTKKLSLTQDSFNGQSLADIILAPTKIYSEAFDLFNDEECFSLAHITGGGIASNIARVIPEGVCAEVDLNLYPEIPAYEWLKSLSIVSREDMTLTFNMGIGMVAMVAESKELGAPWIEIGRVTESSGPKATVKL